MTNDVNDADVGRRIAQARARLGLTQEELAEKAGVRQQQISKWEGGVVPETPNVQRLLRTLGVCGRWLLLGEGSMLPRLPGDGPDLEELAEDLDALVQRLRHRGVTETGSG